jgi:class 3 adenylate cyclase/tetratricopeptide (TPR) repeat protein
MQCPRCHAENRDGLRFCEDCGSRVTLTCAQCGGELTAGKRFCGACGAPVGGESTARVPSPESYTPRHLAEKILTSKGALEGERKQVTVLFADLKGSMELLADRDPEHARRILDPVLERMMSAVHSFEGTVNQVMGDGIMALFGAPLAHEDHAIRACYAALRMQESVRRYADEARRAHGVTVQIRVGINSGAVVVRAIGGDLHMDYTAVGQTTHLAARMEQLASPGSVLLTPATLALVEGFVDVRPLGPVPVKGLAEPLEVYEVTGPGPARTRLQAAARRGLTRFVGRDPELNELRRAQELAGAGHGQVAAIVGEAGVGKSRLVYEFTHSHRLRDWLVLESTSVSYGKATSYLPVIDLFKSYFKIQERDELREIREKVTGKLFALDRSLETALPALLTLLDVPVDDPGWRALDPGQRRLRTLDAVKRLLLREAREQPLVVIFEDLHWIDGETQALLDGLVDSLGSARLLLLVNYRPEYRHRWASKATYRQMRLDPLPVESAGELLDALLGPDPGLRALKQLLVAQGNPFFLEESVRTLVETKALAGERGRFRLTQPVHAIQVPPTVQAMLAARIDRLTPDDKRLLQMAAVVGKDVPFALLQAIAELPAEALHGGLARLQAAEFLYETGLYPDLEYSFAHALTHEVAYAGLLQDRRRELHARIVDALERLHPERIGEETERLAYHSARGHLREKAVHYLRLAGVKAAARSALPEALAWFEQALEALAEVPESRPTLEQGFDIRLEMRPVLSQLAEQRRAFERVVEAQALAERLDDDHRRGLVYAFMASHQASNAPSEALVAGRRALAIAERQCDLGLRLVTTDYLEQAHFWRSDYETVVTLATENLARLPTNASAAFYWNVAPISVYDRNWLAQSLAHLGRFGEATTSAAEAIRFAEASRHPNSIGIAHHAIGVVYLLQGDWTNALGSIEHAISLYRAGHFVMVTRTAICSSSWALAQLGDASRAEGRLEEGEQLIERYSASGVVGYLGWTMYSLGRACLLLGRLDQAQALAEHAIAAVPEHTGVAAYARHLLGDVATHPDRFDAERGGAHYRAAFALAAPRGMRPLVAHCHLGLGKLYRRAGDPVKAHEYLTSAATMYREMDMGFWLEQVEAALGSPHRNHTEPG